MYNVLKEMDSFEIFKEIQTYYIRLFSSKEIIIYYLEELERRFPGIKEEFINKTKEDIKKYGF